MKTENLMVGWLIIMKPVKIRLQIERIPTRCRDRRRGRGTAHGYYFESGRQGRNKFPEACRFARLEPRKNIQMLPNLADASATKLS